MAIQRRDFLNGMALTLAASLTPLELFANSTKQIDYPPLRKGLIGEGDTYGKLQAFSTQDFDFLHISENYDLVVVGAGLSGLSAAYFYQKQYPKAKILLLENSDDFGGHARRDEFNIQGKTYISYGGSESLQSPKALFNDDVQKLFQELRIDVDALADCFDKDFYNKFNLTRGVYFSKDSFGVDKVVNGNPSRVVADELTAKEIRAKSFEAFIEDFPLKQEDKQRLKELYHNPKDYFTPQDKQKEGFEDKISYLHFLRDKVKLSEEAIKFFEGMGDDFFAYGIDIIPYSHAIDSLFPGAKVETPKEESAYTSEPYVYHFPDGNASVARLLLKKLIPSVSPEESLHLKNISLSKFDYSKLDQQNTSVKLRLNALAIRVKNTDNGAEVVYYKHKTGETQKISCKKVVMASYNGHIPFVIPSLSETQKEALAQNVRTPLVYAKVMLRNWESFVKLGVFEVYAPKSPFARIRLDYPVNIAPYQFTQNPKEPICIHMTHAPISYLLDEKDRGKNPKEQADIARTRLLSMPFKEYEALIRKTLQGMLGVAGFNHQKDILAITLNRWTYGYSYFENPLFDDPKKSLYFQEQAKKTFKNIAIANSDASWTPYVHTAIQEALRAVKEIL